MEKARLRRAFSLPRSPSRFDLRPPFLDGDLTFAQPR